MAVAACGYEGEEEDGGVVTDVDQRGSHDGPEPETHVAEDEGDAEEEDEDWPGEGSLEAMDEGEEDAGEDGGEDEGVAGEFVGGVPGFARGGGAGKREPVVGYGEAAGESRGRGPLQRKARRGFRKR